MGVPLDRWMATVENTIKMDETSDTPMTQETPR